MAEGQGNGGDGPEKQVEEVVAQAERPVLTLKITYDPQTHRLDVTGPSDLIVALGMCEMAKGVIMRGNQQQRSIVPATILPPVLRGR